MDDLRKRKVLFVTPNTGMGGSLIALISLCNSLKETNYEPIVIYNKKGSAYHLLEENEIKNIQIPFYNWGVPIGYKMNIKRRIKRIRDILVNFLADIRIARLIHTEGIELVHINSSWTYVGVLAAKIKKVPVIWHFREAMEEDQNSTPWGGFWNRLFDKVEMIVTISDFITQKAKTRTTNHNIRRIYDGVSTEKYFIDMADKPVNDMTEFLMSGTMLVNDGKGFLIAIEACRELQIDNTNNYHLTILGTGDNLQKIESLIHQYGLEKNIILAGRQSDTRAYYKNADCFIMASKSEGFGLVTVEAMLGGCFVIGSASGATPELINGGEVGLLFSVGDSKALADKMKQVIGDSTFVKNKARCGQVFACDNFSSNQNTEKIVELYDSLCVGE